MTRRSSGAVVAAVAVVAIALGAVLAGGPETAGARGGGLELQRIGNFESPVYVAAAPGAGKLLFVVEQPGTVRLIRGGKVLKRPFLELRDRVRYGGEQGLLSIAFDPRYRKTRRLFVYYVNRDGDIRVDSLRAKGGDATRADRGSRRRLIEIAHPVNANHNGGQLQFGPDRMLYMGTGDGGGAGDASGNAQDPSSLLGKLLRVEPKAKRGYRIPASNPFADGGGRGEIYSLGLRNPYRFSFDRRTGDLWIGDVGQDAWEEVDHATDAEARGANFGWNLFEGDHPFEGDAGDPPPNYRPPVLEYSSRGGGCAITGGYVSRDRSLPALAGRYLYADFCIGEIRSLDAGAPNPGATDRATGLRVASPSSFGEGAGGRLYVVSLDGPVYRIRQR
ncbi:MAG: sugar dehydrogenase [Solirubrobacterales bacterium]|nr:sugar dehydrogenase [Solirubrobacterales bacterium]